MFYPTTFDQQSNKADWIFPFKAIDPNGQLIDLTAAEIVCSIKGKRGQGFTSDLWPGYPGYPGDYSADYAIITISTTTGGITLLDPNTPQFTFTKDLLGCLFGRYEIGCVYVLPAGSTGQLFKGRVAFYDGIAIA
jgi:hypothetical protein